MTCVRKTGLLLYLQMVATLLLIPLWAATSVSLSGFSGQGTETSNIYLYISIDRLVADLFCVIVIVSAAYSAYYHFKQRDFCCLTAFAVITVALVLIVANTAPVFLGIFKREFFIICNLFFGYSLFNAVNNR